MADDETKTPRALSELPADELLRYARELGLNLADGTPPGELLRSIRQRQELLLELDRQALLDICVWAREPVRQSASKEQLAKVISGITCMRFEGLSHAGLVALARLRGLPAGSDEPDEVIIQRLRSAEPLWQKLRRKRRAWIGSLISKVVAGEPPRPVGEYKFLPEEDGAAQLRRQIEEAGVVGGIARRIKGVADDYVRQKLDEIEARIDRKLDEIDRRLSEWRDREIANRLRIIKITLVASIIVAALSLGYSILRSKLTESRQAPALPAPAKAVPDPAAADPRDGE